MRDPGAAVTTTPVVDVFPDGCEGADGAPVTTAEFAGALKPIGAIKPKISDAQTSRTRNANWRVKLKYDLLTKTPFP